MENNYFNQTLDDSVLPFISLSFKPIFDSTELTSYVQQTTVEVRYCQEGSFKNHILRHIDISWFSL